MLDSVFKNYFHSTFNVFIFYKNRIIIERANVQEYMLEKIPGLTIGLMKQNLTCQSTFHSSLCSGSLG